MPVENLLPWHLDLYEYQEPQDVHQHYQEAGVQENGEEEEEVNFSTI